MYRPKFGKLLKGVSTDCSWAKPLVTSRLGVSPCLMLKNCKDMGYNRILGNSLFHTTSLQTGNYSLSFSKYLDHSSKKRHPANALAIKITHHTEKVIVTFRRAYTSRRPNKALP